MEWTPRLTQLNYALADLVPNTEGIRRFAKDAGIREAFINFNGSPMDIWNSAIDEAYKNEVVDDLVRSVLKQYPKNDFLKAAIAPKEINYSLGPKIDDASWVEPDRDTLELLTMDIDTLLPISFLAQGIICSRSVAKVEIKRPSGYEVGTGFLFKIEGIDLKFFMTNSHVISDKVDIPLTKLIFNYEEDINGNTLTSKIFKIDPAGPWYNSPVSELDVTVFKLTEDPGDEFGYIPLNQTTISKNEFVNIIQHPGGQLKKIALYHNVVTNVSGNIIQYLTDTRKGSSGSPVFNSHWDVVGLHHSGGEQKIGEPTLKDAQYRNEGIMMNHIIRFIKKSHL